MVASGHVEKFPRLLPWETYCDAQASSVLRDDEVFFASIIHNLHEIVYCFQTLKSVASTATCGVF